MAHSARRVGRRWLKLPAEWRPLAPAWIAIGVLTLVFLAFRAVGYQPSLDRQLLVYLIGMVAVNLPHGGFEHVENLRRRSPSYQAAYVGGFLALIVLFVAVLVVAPVLGVCLMLWVAMAKGGHGDVAAVSAVIGDDHLRTRPQRFLAAVAKGGAVMLVPFVAWHGTFVAFTSYMVNVFEPGALVDAAWLVGETARIVVGTGYAAVVALHIGVGLRLSDDRRAWAIDAAETLLLIAYFVLVPVVIAVGLYFAFWYSLRQLGRSWVADDRRPTDDGAWMVDPGDPRLRSLFNWGSFVVGAVATGLVLGGIYLVASEPFGGAPTLLAGAVVLYTVFVSIIALPHVLVGGWLDRQGIWFVPDTDRS